MNTETINTEINTGQRVIGIGNRHRGDDAIGLILAEKIQAETLDHVQVLFSNGDPMTLIQDWQGADKVILIDAVSVRDAVPGTLYCFHLNHQPLPAVINTCSSHFMGLNEAVNLSKAMGTLPEALIFFGIAGHSFGLGEGLSPPMAACSDDLLARIRDALKQACYPIGTQTSPKVGDPLMHEFSLMADLMKKIEQLAQEAEAGKVTRIHVKLGALAHISADHFREHFTHATQGTVAEGARLDVETLTDTNDPYAQDIVLESIEAV